MSANSNLLTENSWRAVVQRFRLRDNGLQRALAAYENLDEDQHDERLRRIASINQLATALRRNREVAAAPDAVTHLTDLIAAAAAEQRNITRAKAQAQRAEATAQRRAGPDAEQDEDEQESDDQAANHGALLLAAYDKLKRSRDLSYPFIVCDARPYCGLMIAKRITPQHRTELTRVTGGRRFLPGTCSVEAGVLNFSMDRPPSGLAHKLQESFRQFTGRRIRVTVGTETAEGEDEEDGVAAQLAETDERAQAPADADGAGETEVPADVDASSETGAPTRPGVSAQRETTPRRAAPTSGAEAAERPRPAAATPTRPRATVARAPQVWHGTRGIVDRRIQALKQAVRAEYANSEPDLIQEIDQKLGRLDDVLGRLDHRLADTLANAHNAANPTAQTAELRNARTILADYIRYVSSEPLIARIDANPFGVNTQLRRLLTDSLTHMAQAIGPVNPTR